MNEVQLRERGRSDQPQLERVNYFPRMLIGVSEMDTEQKYFLDKLRRHNRFLHGWGVVCGLKVAPVPTRQAPWRVCIGPGYALGPYGDEIYVPEPGVMLDLHQCGPGAITDPCEPDLLRKRANAANGTLFVAIKYAECVARPVRAEPASCACEEDVCEYSRIRDSFEIGCLSEQPSSPKVYTLCDYEKELPSCPPCPEDPWVVLAEVTVPNSTNISIENKMIDNFVRRQIFSTAVLQEQLISCCCDKKSDGAPQKADIKIRELSITGDFEEPVFNIKIKNLGPSRAEEVVLTSTVGPTEPAGYEKPKDFQINNGKWVTKSLPELKAKLGTMEKDQEISLSFKVNKKFGSDPNLVKISVKVTSKTSDPDSENNEKTAEREFIN